MRVLPLVGAGVALAACIGGRRHLTDRTRALLAGVAVALALVGTGVVELPNLQHAIGGLGSTLGPYTYVLVGVMAFLETGAGIGLIVPGEFAVIVGGVAAGQGEVDLVPLIALVWVCAVAGDVLSYLLGRHLGRDFIVEHGHRIKLTADRLERVERYFDRHGVKTILIGRFVGLVRSLAPFAAGTSGMAPARFIPATVAAAGIWAAVCTLVGYVFWQSFDDAVAIAERGTLAIAAVAMLVVGGIAAVRALRRQRAGGVTDGPRRTCPRSP